MIQVFELRNREFKITMIIMLRVLMAEKKAMYKNNWVT